MKKLALFFAMVLLNSCIELYEFDLKSNSKTLVVEGNISDKSFNDSKNFPSDGRYFSIKLKWTGNVTNRHDEPVHGASIKLVNDQEVEYAYTESTDTPGTYYLLEPSFYAKQDRKYQLRIALSDGEIYESDWEQMVQSDIPAMGDISFDEVYEKVYIWKSGEQEVDTEQGININIQLPPNTNKKSIYYKWDFDPMWIYIAPLGSIKDYDYKCWVTNNTFLNTFTIKEDEEGGYKNKLLYMTLRRNERYFQKLSILVTQQAMTERNYRFWNDMVAQSERGGLFDAPPYNLDSNIHQVNGDKPVSGYFGVVKEQAKRWYFKRLDLSYKFYVEDYLRYECIYYGDPPARECYSCLAYTKGTPSLEKPSWWED